MIPGLGIVAQGMHGSHHSWQSFLPILSGVVGALLGIGYAEWIHHRVATVQRILS